MVTFLFSPAEFATSGSVFGNDSVISREIQLVGKLPPVTSPASELKPENINYLHLPATTNFADIALIKSVLDGKDIVHYFQGASFTYLMAQLTKLMVSEDDIGALKNLSMS